VGGERNKTTKLQRSCFGAFAVTFPTMIRSKKS